MSKASQENTKWAVCLKCQGQGRKSRGLSKKEQTLYQQAVAQFEQSDCKGIAPIRPKGQLHICTNCNGTGLVSAAAFPAPDTANLPHVAIIGGGIGGVALAVACLHRGIPFTLYERDTSFDARAQGYGLTLQQASKAIKGLGITQLAAGVVSTKHIVHTTDGKVIGTWGARKWLDTVDVTSDKRTNIHIARQSLRFALLDQLGTTTSVQWGHQLVGLTQNGTSGVQLDFQVNGTTQTHHADLVVGADGIRSAVRKLVLGDNIMPLRYLDCLVILGICPLAALKGVESPLLDSATVFQTANGHERIYMMPFTADSVMWQLSFPLAEEDALKISEQGAEALKQEAINRTQWHSPIPQIIAATQATAISGYPVYDRALLTPQLLQTCGDATLIGDAAHPMSPFKGQGANQALLDALQLARTLYKSSAKPADWKKVGIRQSVLVDFETEMLQRSAIKVKGSAEAAVFLHSDVVLKEGDVTRGSTS